jgi:hypothetical protein
LNAFSGRKYRDAFIVMVVEKQVQWSVEYKHENLLWFILERSHLSYLPTEFSMNTLAVYL